MKYYYLYETINLSNGKKYIGQHCTKNLNDGYYGSSKLLKSDIKNGDRYVVNIIKFFDNIYDLGNSEYELIKKLDAHNDPMYYNGNNGKYFNEYFDNKRDDNFSKKMSGKKRTIEFRNSLSGDKNPFYGKKHSKESLLLMSKKRSGITAWNKGITQRWIKKGTEQKMVFENELDIYLDKGWTIGRLPFKNVIK